MRRDSLCSILAAFQCLCSWSCTAELATDDDLLGEVLAAEQDKEGDRQALVNDRSRVDTLDALAPSLTLVAPTNVELAPGDLSVVVDVRDDVAVSDVELIWFNGGSTRTFSCARPDPAVRCVRSDARVTFSLRVGTGERYFRVRAIDTSENAALIGWYRLNFSEAPPAPPDPGPGDGDGNGTCCSDGDCLCHGPDPRGLTSASGPFAASQLTVSAGTVYYPTDAEPPLASVAVTAGYYNTGAELRRWGTFYASHGIVAVIVTTGALDQANVRARKMLDAISELKALGRSRSGPLAGKLSDRYGTSGFSMGGGGSAIASATDPSLRTSIGLAPYQPAGSDVRVATLLLCGSSDSTAPCRMSSSFYGAIPSSTPKMQIEIPGATHGSWFGPEAAGRGVSGQYALAFQKVFLEGDERWRPLLLQRPASGTQTTNIR